MLRKKYRRVNQLYVYVTKSSIFWNRNRLLYFRGVQSNPTKLTMLNRRHRLIKQKKWANFLHFQFSNPKRIQSTLLIFRPGYLLLLLLSLKKKSHIWMIWVSEKENRNRKEQNRSHYKQQIEIPLTMMRWERNVWGRRPCLKPTDRPTDLASSISSSEIEFFSKSTLWGVGEESKTDYSSIAFLTSRKKSIFVRLAKVII